MIEDRTVFVLGAGASCPYGYPSGIELRRLICQTFCGRYNDYMMKRSKINRSDVGEYSLAKEFTEVFKKSTTKSIDLFLSVNQEFMDIGKKAIVVTIFTAEFDSHFREDLADKKNIDWYSHLYHKLTDGLTNKNDYIKLGENKISFITFNYDRSLEHFLYDSLINYFYKVPTEKIKEQLNKLKIIHVFGQIAGLEWQDLTSKIEYRSNLYSIDIQKLIRNIKIIYEEKENPELAEAHNLIREAQHIFFLGFGYAKENLELLKIPKVLNYSHEIYGTALGLKPKEIQDIRCIFPQTVHGDQRSNVHMGNEKMDCLAFLRDNW